MLNRYYDLARQFEVICVAKDVIWKEQLHFFNNFYFVFSPDNNVVAGSGGGLNANKTTVPDEQHIPAV